MIAQVLVGSRFSGCCGTHGVALVYIPTQHGDVPLSLHGWPGSLEKHPAGTVEASTSAVRLHKTSAGYFLDTPWIPPGYPLATFSRLPTVARWCSFAAHIELNHAGRLKPAIWRPIRADGGAPAGWKVGPGRGGKTVNLDEKRSCAGPGVTTAGLSGLLLCPLCAVTLHRKTSPGPGAAIETVPSPAGRAGIEVCAAPAAAPPSS